MNKRKVWVLVTLGAILGALTACGAAQRPTEPIYDVISAPEIEAGQPLPQPTGEVILTVEGAISNTNTAAGMAEFDRAMLEDMRLVQYDVTDPFEKEVRMFTGVLLSDLMAVVDAAETAGELELVALNDYSAVMPMSDVENYPMMLSLTADGRPYELDEGGPTIVVVPFDDYPAEELDHVTYDALWVWSMTRIVVR